MATPTTASRRIREQAERHGLIVHRARALAEAEGWESVTTRRLAEAIEYSQPVLYSHFPGGKAEIMNAVALAGFAEISEQMSIAGRQPNGHSRLAGLVMSYLNFASANPAVYQAMFALPIAARFAVDQPATELKAAFDSMISALEYSAESLTDPETAAELLWCSMHGMATLERDQRLRPADHQLRVDQLVGLFVAAQ